MGGKRTAAQLRDNNPPFADCLPLIANSLRLANGDTNGAARPLPRPDALGQLAGRQQLAQLVA